MNIRRCRIDQRESKHRDTGTENISKAQTQLTDQFPGRHNATAHLLTEKYSRNAKADTNRKVSKLPRQQGKLRTNT